MRKGRRWLVLPISVVALLALGMPPSSADHATRDDVRNLNAVGESPNTDSLANSDMAFWGDLAFQGHWEGFRVIDISDPTNPTQLLDYTDCTDPTLGLGGGQGDVIVWEDLLVRAWNSGASPTGYCGRDSNGDPMDLRDGFEGVNVFDISDVTDPQMVAAVDIDTDAASKPAGVTTGCGAHTLTAVPDPSNGRLLIYVGGSSQLCPGMDLVEVPLNDPASAEWYGRAVNPSGRACHDISVYMIDKNRAACSGSTANNTTTGQHGWSYWSMDGSDGGSLEDPALLYERNVSRVNRQTVSDPNENGVTLGHTSSWSWDGKIFLWSTEPGGGVNSNCEETDADENREMYFFSAELGEMKGKWTIPTQSADESCASIHIMQSIPTTNGLDVMSSGTYMAGTYVVDYTDPTNPHAIGWSDPPADIAPAPTPSLILGGAWATYWYNGYLYESNIKKGLFVFEPTSPEAQTPVELDFMNPQTMMEVPPVPVLCQGEEATLIGTSNDDAILGTTGRDVIAALGGGDDVAARAGNDLVCAGKGNDQVRGGDGNDELLGQEGRDTLAGGAGNDLCSGGPGQDSATNCERRFGIP
jgi:hemolysin type calcium-binding protein/LVIVD repeat-containing protein